MATKKRDRTTANIAAIAERLPAEKPRSLEAVIESIDPRRGERTWHEQFASEHPDLHAEMTENIRQWADGAKFQGYTAHRIAEAIIQWLPERFRRKPNAVAKFVKEFAADVSKPK